jgi:hypothetical protein
MGMYVASLDASFKKKEFFSFFLFGSGSYVG